MIVGTVSVGRMAYRRRGEPNLYPADAVLNLPEELHSHGLRQLAAVTSSDGSFVPPQVSGPVLTVRAHYGLGHDVEAGGEWVYRVGDTEQSVSLAAASGLPIVPRAT